MSRRVILVDYDPWWPREYASERQRLLETVGPWLLAGEHIGSTSVPGLAAKPTIDIMAAVRLLADCLYCIEPLRALGYEYVPDDAAAYTEAKTAFIRGIEAEAARWSAQGRPAPADEP